MRLYYIGIIRPKSGSKKTLTLSEQKNLADFSFFQRGSVGQFMTFFAETIAERTKPSQRQSVEEGNYIGHVYTRSEGVSGVIITDKDYPIRPAYTLLNKLLDEYISTHPESEWVDLDEANETVQMDQLQTYIDKYQNPAKADAIMKVQQELDETKIVLQKSIESVLQRGEQLDSLVDKSEALTASSKTFYKQAKKTNSCCVIV
ncbi:DEKNAAC102482 [Brettanomyces naardenensis]|uniref:Synaptobrevin homolog YKT6 n=1 Tax=Brettanomyces naardenensis TaxID=13370 RepID=A0A448YKX4_BRENA|nr:DEKNAAC102482 [Brettanomyces naardenensis]